MSVRKTVTISTTREACVRLPMPPNFLEQDGVSTDVGKLSDREAQLVATAIYEQFREHVRTRRSKLKEGV